MIPILRRWRWSVLTLALVVAVTAAAAPILKRPRLSDEFMALVNLSRINVEVSPLPKELIHFALRDADVFEQTKRLLSGAGFEIVDTDQASRLPRVQITIEIRSDLRSRNTFAFIMFLDVYQKAHLHRLGVDLVIPTTRIIRHGTAGTKLLKKTVQQELQLLVKQFVAAERQASKNV